MYYISWGMQHNLFIFLLKQFLVQSRPLFTYTGWSGNITSAGKQLSGRQDSGQAQSMNPWVRETWVQTLGI